MPSEQKPPQTDPGAPGEKFQLSTGWLLVGLLAIALGIACGLVMSSASLLR
jgi:hypothetical protein